MYLAQNGSAVTQVECASVGIKGWENWVLISLIFLPTLSAGKLPKLSKLHCLHLLKGNQSTCFVGMLWGLNEKVNTRHCMTQKVAAAKIITNMTSGQTEACTGPAGASLVAQG